jgi:hypothetical protein
MRSESWHPFRHGFTLGHGGLNSYEIPVETLSHPEHTICRRWGWFPQCLGGG